MKSGIHAVMHPTDFSELNLNAFVHALKIGLAAKAKLYLLHVTERADEDPWASFPHVRQTLARWGLFAENEPPTEITRKLGIQVAKVEIEPQHPVSGFLHFLAAHPSDLIVLATRGREGLPRWLRPSIAEQMSRHSATRTLFISAQCRGFVDQARGEIKLKTVLVPIDHSPAPAAALRALRQLCVALDADPALRLVHVGTKAPALAASEPGLVGAVEMRGGDVVDGILQAAGDVNADLIVMATAGHHGMLDALRGGTTERVLRQAPCPVLAVPVVASR